MGIHQKELHCVRLGVLGDSSQKGNTSEKIISDKARDTGDSAFGENDLHSIQPEASNCLRGTPPVPSSGDALLLKQFNFVMG
ncbi:MAG: uncharacterized protein KVP18_004990 [Porospora cf. gigantea A]|uniref:uncharacterized protein n=1 Tax=Porospora cf. gigantea A TaxID=2853593 RepID=UPI00355A1269|nr:MAG: hypothetical protein KVP18_004990 [Porospora cf. gigantea A]